MKMELSSEMINAIDTLARRFGIIIDWQSNNIMLCLQQMYKKYIIYNIFLNCFYLVLSVGMLLLGFYWLYKSEYYSCKMKEFANYNTLYSDKYMTYSEYEDKHILYLIIAILSIVCGVVCTFFIAKSIMGYVIFPEEMMLLDINNLLKNGV